MKKTVYILGAGFSIEAGAPAQEKLVRLIFETLEKEEPENIKKFHGFLRNTLAIQDELHSKVPLEDIFTPLDRCLADNISFRNLSVTEIKEMRGLIYYLMGKTLQKILADAANEKEYVDAFATHLFNECIIRKTNKRADPVSVISTNWDILVDTSIQKVIDASKQDAVVDYCCYIGSFAEGDERIKPGVEVLGRGGFNVKLLKLHGSLNWLQCPQCLRVYVDLDDKIAVNQYQLHETCRHCNKHFGEQQSHELISNLIMPTFLKDFSNPQYKLIWQNAGIELSEADKIVFIGYSLPQADFEMRQLLARMIKTDAEIEVVTYDNGDKNTLAQFKERYNVFFGKRKPTYYLKGAKQYVLEHFGA